MPGQKDHHIIAASYQKRFSFDHHKDSKNKQVCEYDLHRGSVTIRKPKKIATRRQFYSLTKEGSEPNTQLEDLLGEIENAVCNLMPKLECRQALTAEEFDDLVYFTAFQAVRGQTFDSIVMDTQTAYLRRFKQLFDGSDENRKQWESYPCAGKSVPYHEACRFIAGVEMIPIRNAVVKEIHLAANVVAEALRQRTWLFMCTDDLCPFVTSDEPVVIVPPDRDRLTPCGVATPGATIIFPLSKNRCAMIFGDEWRIDYLEAEYDCVRAINREVCRNADRYLVGPTKEIMRIEVERAFGSKNYSRNAPE